MTSIVEMKFGSHLFGTQTPSSDLDFKAVHLPPAQDILLGRVKQVVTNNTKLSDGIRNAAGDVDRESYTLQKFLSLAAEGQTVAMDMLFATDDVMVSEPSPLWREIQDNRHRIVTSRASSFVGYCRTQANKYGIKGSRMAAARSIVEFLGVQSHSSAKLATIEPELTAFVAASEHMAIVDIAQTGVEATLAPMRHIEVCNRKMPFHATIKRAYDTYKGLFDEYGARARQAEINEGVDWKALSHAVRVARECIELLETGSITFPRPERAHLVAIKTGALAYKKVAEEIDALLPLAESASEKSTLRAEPDREWIDALVAREHKKVISEWHA